MKCPHCAINFHETEARNDLLYLGSSIQMEAYVCYCPGCQQYSVKFCDPQGKFTLIYPKSSTRGPVPFEVPSHIAEDYTEACLVLADSAKASAALSRRCLQSILHSQGYKSGSLAKEIGLLLNETDPAKGIPLSLRTTVDAIRNFGNFSAHPISDLTTKQIIEVEDHEAEFCLEVIEEMFEHFYVRPAKAEARKAALDAKLSAAGKPKSQ